MAERSYRKKLIGNRRLSPETQMMGYGFDPSLSEMALKPPIFMTSTFAFNKAADGKSFFEVVTGKRELGEDEEQGLIYSRFNNPDMEIFEDRLALWEEAEKGLAFASGMAAISTALLAYVRPGDVIVHCTPIYGATESLIRNILPTFGVHSVEFLAGTEEDTLTPAIEEANKLGRVAVIYGETPGNPANTLVDMVEIAEMAAKVEAETDHRPITMIDNTFLGPVWQQPCKHGIDISLYSLTKYVGGHSDLIAGGAVGSRAALAPVQKFRSALGTMTDANTAWLLMRSLETVQIRFERAAENAKKVATYLKDHPKIDKVHFLDFLPEGRSRRIYEEQCQSAGSTFAFEVKGGEEEAFKVLDAFKVIKLAVSLGGTETLCSCPYSMTHSGVADDLKARLGITPQLLRISIGIENPDDLIADLEQALAEI